MMNSNPWYQDSSYLLPDYVNGLNSSLITTRRSQLIGLEHKEFIDISKSMIDGDLERVL